MKKVPGPERPPADRFRRWAAALAIPMLLAMGVGPASASDPVSSARLVRLARLWGFVKYHHPYLAYRADIDWDAALAAAIPKVRDARSPEAYEAAVRDMLAELGDPLTGAESAPNSHSSAEADGTAGHLESRLTEDDILIITVGDYFELTSAESRTALENVVAAVPKARAVVFDLRSAAPADDYARIQLEAALNPVERLMASHPLAAPGRRRRVYYGLAGSSPFSSGQYRTGFFTRSGQALAPAAGARDVPSVVLVNRLSAPSDWAVARQAAGLGLIVFEGDPSAAAFGPTENIDLGENLVAHVRVEEAIFADGTSAALVADLLVTAAPKSGVDPALDAALDLARRFHPSIMNRSVLPAAAAVPVERSYPEMECPAFEYRLLSLFRLWNAIEYFYPYKALLDRNWDSVLPEFLPAYEAADDAVAYSKAVARTAVRIQDNHAYVSGPVYNGTIIGNGFPPVRVRLIEGRPVITAIYDPRAGAAGVSVGDIVLRVDGEDAEERLEALRDLVSASTPQNFDDKAALVFMNGPVESDVRLTLRDSAGSTREVVLTRRREDYSTLYHRERTGEIVKLLEGDIGYVDLDRLTYDMVDPMFERLKSTRAIIFDMRGYPNGTIWAIATRLTSLQPRVALFETPLVGHGSPAPASEAFFQTVGPTPPGAWTYEGRTAMVMDERTVSQAEHTGLYLLAANGTTLVGSPTAGSDGEVTAIPLPGGISVGFTGQAVRYPDGRQLQRVGLIPDVPAQPTIEGIREGRDEVLEAAIRFFRRSPGPPILSSAEDPPSATVIEEALFRLINSERASRGLPPLRLSPALVRLAREHSDEMAASDRLTHDSAGGKSFHERLTGASVPFSANAENIARTDYCDPGNLHRSFMGSPSHRRNILNSRFDEVGIGVTFVAGNVCFVTEDFVGSLPGRTGGGSRAGGRHRRPQSPLSRDLMTRPVAFR